MAKSADEYYKGKIKNKDVSINDAYKNANDCNYEYKCMGVVNGEKCNAPLIIVTRSIKGSKNKTYYFRCASGQTHIPKCPNYDESDKNSVSKKILDIDPDNVDLQEVFSGILKSTNINKNSKSVSKNTENDKDEIIIIDDSKVKNYERVFTSPKTPNDLFVFLNLNCEDNNEYKGMFLGSKNQRLYKKGKLSLTDMTCVVLATRTYANDVPEEYKGDKYYILADPYNYGDEYKKIYFRLVFDSSEIQKKFKDRMYKYINNNKNKKFFCFTIVAKFDKPLIDDKILLYDLYIHNSKQIEILKEDICNEYERDLIDKGYYK